MLILCNVTGAERKKLAQALGEITLWEPEYAGPPSFAYKVGNYSIDKNGTILCPDSATPDMVKTVANHLKEKGFAPDISPNTPEVPAPATAPQPEAKAGAKRDILPDKAKPEESAPATKEASTSDETTRVTISIPRSSLTDDAITRLRGIIKNKEILFKRAVLADELPVEVDDEKISFPWFTLTGIPGEMEAYAQFLTQLCKMASEQTRILDRAYDGDNDRFAMRIFMVRLNMKGPEFALARKLMMQHLTGDSGWRYGDSNKGQEKNPHRTTIQHLQKAYQTGTPVRLIPMGGDAAETVSIGASGTVDSVDDSGNVFIRLENGSTFGIALITDQPASSEETPDNVPEAEPTDSETNKEA